MADNRDLAAIITSRYWRDEDARAVMAAWRASGLTAAEFCRRHGLRASRLLRWSKSVAGESTTSAPLSFVELTVGRSVAVTGPAPLEVVVGGAVIRVSRGFDPPLLAEVVETLRSVRC